MELVLSKAAVKFLEKLSPKAAEKLQNRLAYLLQSLEAEAIIPFNELRHQEPQRGLERILQNACGKS